MNIIKKITNRLFVYLCYLFPVNKKKILLSSYEGKGYNDNLKYIADKLLKFNELKLVWPVKNNMVKATIPSGIKTCKYGSLAYLYHMATAGVWIDNCRKGFYYKKKNQLYIQTWHGGGAQKRIEMDVQDVLGPDYVKWAKKDSRQIDLMISESTFTTKLYHRAFWYNGPVWECGYPRYDFLFNTHNDLKEKVYDFYHIDKDKALVLYAPTFRKDNSLDAYNIDFTRIKNALEAKLNKKVVFLIRLHPNLIDRQLNIEYDGKNIINATKYADAQELICAATMLIGDYSSINFDCALMNKPVLRYTTDIDDYKADRNFYYDFDEYPYPYATNNDELEELINKFNYEIYIKNLNKFFDKLGLIKKQNASEEIAEFVFNYANFKGNKKSFMQLNSEKFIYKDKEIK